MIDIRSKTPSSGILKRSPSSGILTFKGIRSEIVDPNGDFNAVWTGHNYQDAVKTTRYPETPDLEVYAAATDADDNEEQIWTVAPISNLALITKLELYCYTIGSSGLSNSTGKVYVGGSLVGSIPIPALGSAQWKILTINGSWAKSQLQTGFRVGFLTPTLSKLAGFFVYQAYIKATGY